MGNLPKKENHDSHHTLPPENVESSVIVEDLIATTNGASKSFKIIAIGLGIMSVLGIIALVLKWINYSDDSTRWGYVAALVSFLLSITGGAPMVAMGPVMAKANWVRPLTRLAAIFSFAGVSTIIVLIPLLFLLPPLVVYGTRRRSIWFEAPNYSPHIWGIIGMVLLLITGIALFYSAALPDFAVMRENSTGWRQKLGKKLARGWVGTDSQWRTLRMRIGMFGTFYFFVMVMVNFLYTTDFAQGVVPGYRDAIYTLYHTVSSWQGGVAALVIALWIVRRNMKLEKYIHLDAFWSLGRLLFALTLLWIYLFYSSFIVFWYGRSENDKATLDLLVRGPMIWAFLAGATFIWLVPWWILIWNRVRKSINGMAIGSCVIIIGLLLDRIRLFVSAWSVPQEFIHQKWLKQIPGTIYPDIFDVIIALGSISLSILMIMLMTKIIPVLSIWQIQEFNLLSKPIKFIKGHATLIAKPD